MRDKRRDKRRDESLAEMLQHRLKKLKIYCNTSLEFSVLAEYDGLGCCESISIVKRDSSTPLDSWAQSVGWVSRPIPHLFGEVLLYERKSTYSFSELPPEIKVKIFKYMRRDERRDKRRDEMRD